MSVMRRCNFAGVVLAACLAACLAASTPGYALSLQDKLTAWADASEDERLVVARALTLVASQGLSQLDETFFEDCIEFASKQTSLQSKRIGEVGAMCVAMHTRFSARDPMLRP